MRGRFCKTVCGWLGLSLVMLSAGAFADDRLPTLNSEQANWVADRIFQNECNRQLSCLTSWNVGEDFPSLGIGHFIWYREGQRERFVESFPELLGYYVARGVDFLAFRIREIAKANDVSVVENPPLARGLYYKTREGQEIPAEFYSAVAEILAAVYRRRHGGRQPVN